MGLRDILEWVATIRAVYFFVFTTTIDIVLHRVRYYYFFITIISFPVLNHDGVAGNGCYQRFVEFMTSGLREMAVIRDLSNWRCHRSIIFRQSLRVGVIPFMS